MSAPLPICRLPAGFAISGAACAFNVLARRDDWPWYDDFAPLDATDRLPQGSHDGFDSESMGCTVIGFTVLRAGAIL